MRQTITKNEKSLKTLSELISRGFYRGVINDSGFELYRINSNAKYWIIGNINNEGKFELTSEFRFPMSILVWAFIITWIIITSILISKSKWFESFYFFTILLFGIVYYLFERRKEIERFTSNFLKFYND